MPLSARNQLPGTVKSVVLGAVMAEVVVDVGGHEVVSVVTRHAAEPRDQGRRRGHGRHQGDRGVAREVTRSSGGGTLGAVSRTRAAAGRLTLTGPEPRGTRRRHGAGQGRLPAPLDHRPLQSALHLLHARGGRPAARARRDPQLRGARRLRPGRRRLRHQQGPRHRRRAAGAPAAAPTSSACWRGPAASPTSR